MPLVVLAGTEYGTGSSRDWAAKGTLLLGVRAVIAASFERIHRSNLVGMGVLPLQFPDGQNLAVAGPDRPRAVHDRGPDRALTPKQSVTVRADGDKGSSKTFQVVARIDTPVDVSYYRNGGILQTVLRSLIQK